MSRFTSTPKPRNPTWGSGKNYQDGRPVALVMTDEQGREYIRIADGDLGPELAIAAP